MGQCRFSKAAKIHDYIHLASGQLLLGGGGQKLSANFNLNVGFRVLEFNKLRFYLANG